MKTVREQIQNRSSQFAVIDEGTDGGPRVLSEHRSRAAAERSAKRDRGVYRGHRVVEIEQTLTPVKPLVVSVRTKQSESRESVILRVLGCESFAQAVNQHGLQNHDEPWKQLEALAANRVHVNRTMNKLGALLKSIGGASGRCATKYSSTGWSSTTPAGTG